MLFSYNLLQSFFNPSFAPSFAKATEGKKVSEGKGKLPKPEKLAEILTMRSFEVEGVEKVGNDYALNIDVLPNRAGDCFSHLGVARESAAITKSKISAFAKATANKQNPKSKIIEDRNLKTENLIKIEVKDKNVCFRYIARVITDIKVGISPEWMKQRLEVCGLKSINNVVDAVNYAMLETGQPMHVFDYDKIESANPPPSLKLLRTSKSSAFAKATADKQIKKIIVRKAKMGEKIITLDNQKYDLDEDILVIADEKEPIAIAGIKGGKKAEIDENTKTIILESANFGRKSIRRACGKLNLRTDASLRFEQGIDANIAEQAVNRASELIGTIARGKICRGFVDFYPRKLLPKRIKLDLDYVEKLLGVKIPEKEIVSILKRLGFKVKEIKLNPPLQYHRLVCGTEKRERRRERILEVEAPTYRLDISIPEDLIEEIARIYGYDKIETKFPSAVLAPFSGSRELFSARTVKDVLKGAGFAEVYNYSFVSNSDAEVFGGPENLAELENPLSENFRYLRPTLIFNILKNIQKNQAEFEDVKIFELGKTFAKAKKIANQNPKLTEKSTLAGAVSGEKSFYRAKGAVELLLNELGISDVSYNEFAAAGSIWHSRRRAEIKAGGQRIGFLGEISCPILESYGIKGRVAMFEFDFEKLAKLASEEREYRPISRFPAAVRDLAALVPETTKAEEVLNKIKNAGKPLAKDIVLFDIYKGKELPEGKKNLAFHIIYQSETKTFGSREIEDAHNKITKALEENTGWEVRK